MAAKKHPESVQDRLRWAREQAEVSARELDRLSGKAEGACAIFEASDRSALVTTTDAYARTLGLSLDWLVRGNGPKPLAREIRRAVASARKAVA